MNIYIACGLTHVPRDSFNSYCDFIHELASTLKSRGARDVKYALVNSDPQLSEKPFSERARLCYYWDREMVEHADIIIAEASFPSTGMGIELQIAENKDIPIILCFMEKEEYKARPVDYENPDHSHHTLQIGDGYVSLMALGLPSVYRVVKYHTGDEGIQQVCDVVQTLNRDLEK